MNRQALLTITILLVGAFHRSSGQSHEAQVLLLDVKKLSQIKTTLEDMKKGYQVLREGYAAVRDIARADFNLQEAFLDGRWLVSPAVRGYWKVPSILSGEFAVVKACKSDLARCRASGSFQAGELAYLQQVYAGVLARAVRSLDDLTGILTDHSLQMSDAERMEAIDRIYDATGESLGFVRRFTSEALVLGVARTKERAGTHTLESLYRIGK